jgi:lipopolysaccharide cholinephosphotransferase
MKEMTIQEIKGCSLGILDFVDNVCRENNLVYYLCGGTLLGAVRHEGFIPWDDDIDIMMPRRDYERLLDIWPRECQYKALYYKNTPDFPYAYGKIIDNRTIKIEPYRKKCRLIGVDIDVFPIDNLPDDDMETVKYYNAIAKIQSKLALQISTYRKGSTILRTVAKNGMRLYERIIESLGVTSIDKTTESFDRLAQKYNQTETEFCGITSISHYGIREKNPKSNFNTKVSVNFEGKEYPAPNGYADYLSRLYGKNYMQLPPVEMRHTHHSYKAFWK